MLPTVNLSCFARRGYDDRGNARTSQQQQQQPPQQREQQRYFQPLTIDTVNIPGQNVTGADNLGTPLLQADRNTSQSPGACSSELASHSFTLKAKTCQHFATFAVFRSYMKLL